MKSPSEISERLTKQWQNGDMREQRLLSVDAWPIQMDIGFPGAKLFVEQPAVVREHIAAWRKVKIGQVDWAEKKYMQSSAPLADAVSPFFSLYIDIAISVSCSFNSFGT